MAKFKLIVSDPSTGKSTVSEVEGARAQALIGRSLGETIDGSPLGIAQSKILITGGCDKNGIPMRFDVHGGVKKHIVLSSPPGFRPARHGERRRKLVRGRIITDDTYQINFVLQAGEVKRSPAGQPEAEPKISQPLAKAPVAELSGKVEHKAGKKPAKKATKKK